MNKLLNSTCFFWIFFLINQSAVFAQSIISIDTEGVIACPAKANQIQAPKFTEPECQQSSVYKVDPQNREIWLKANLKVSQAYLKRQQPSALYVFGKMSSEVFLNGVKLGNNGTPSFFNEDEFSGDMDARFYIPPNLIKEGDNEVIVHASSHHGFLSLANPIHFIGISEYTQTGDFFKRDLLVSICLLGAMLLGCLYLITLVYKSEEKRTSVFILLMLASASGQLFLEISRVLFNYSYPLHDVRLIAIVVLSIIFGLSFLLFSLHKFACRNKKYWFALVVTLVLFLVFWITGFDGKSAVAILVPALFSLFFSAKKYTQMRTSESLAYILAFGLFVATILATFNNFNSMYFYYIVTIMMAFLVMKKTNEFAQERILRKVEEQQVIKLQLKLKQTAQAKPPEKLQLNCAGKVEFIPVNEISHCKASGDYVEIFMSDKRQSLYSGTLKRIEEQLPDSFIKVHRSYVVNMDEVISIASSTKGSSGGGVITLKTGDEVPVSRRILPYVRELIKGTNTSD